MDFPTVFDSRRLDDLAVRMWNFFGDTAVGGDWNHGIL